MADEGDGEAKTSPQQRKEARRARIQRQMREEWEAANPSLRQAQERELTAPEQRIADGLSTLDATKSATIEDTTGVRLEVDVRENRRKAESEAARRDRLHRLQEEALESGRRNAAIEMRWAETLQVDTPQALRDAVQKQVEACAAIRQSKDELVAAFRVQLKAKDEEFVEAVQTHGGDVEELLRRMEKQFHELAASYDEELAAIEDAFDAERASLLKANREEVDALFERRRKQELELVEKGRRMQNEFMDTMDTMRAEDTEEYNQLKIKLQNEIQALEQQLQDMRATYLLNQEKLEYNFRVLTERDVENSNTVLQQKKKLQRLKDSLAKLTTRYQTADAHFKQVNGKLAAEYHKLTDQYHDLMSKNRHFREADKAQVAEVWEMHDEEIRAIRDQVLTADNLLHSHVLGWEWAAPPPPSTKRPLDLERQMDRANSTSGARPNTQATGHSSATGPTSAAGRRRTPGPMAEVDTAESPLLALKIQRLVDLLQESAGFLLDPEAQQQLASMDKEDARVARADIMLEALGVESREELETLVSYFFTSTGEEAGEGEDLAALVDLNLRVAPQDVVSVVKQFVEDRGRERAEDLGAAARTKSRLSDMHARRSRMARVEEEYWRELASPLPPATARVWTALEGALQRYTGVLKDRANLVDEVGLLQHANAELRALLSQYLGGPVNEALYYPPTQVIRVRRT